jgi:acylphosphatase
MKIERVKLHITGKVQEVFFRFFVRDWAKANNINGYVKNLPDGSVEVIAEGTRDNLAQLIEQCYAGPEEARVEDVREKWNPPTHEFSDFSIIQ